MTDHEQSPDSIVQEDCSRRNQGCHAYQFVELSGAPSERCAPGEWFSLTMTVICDVH